MIELREEVGDQLDIQLVAFPQQGIQSFEGGTDLMRKAIDLGVDVVGAIPHFEISREYGEQSVKFAMGLAAEHGLRVDVHCDETDDDHSRFVEVMAAETIRLGLEGRVTASHTTAMHGYNNAYAYRVINNIKRAQMHMVTNPLDNSVLQGRFDSFPIRRGHTRVKELLAAGVNTCIGHDSVMDPWYPLGYGDPLQAAFVLAHYGQMSGAGELVTLIEMITGNPARALGIENYGLAVGNRADLVAFAGALRDGRDPARRAPAAGAPGGQGRRQDGAGRHNRRLGRQGRDGRLPETLPLAARATGWTDSRALRGRTDGAGQHRNGGQDGPQDGH